MNTQTQYTFGDTLTADDRLKRIASFFNPLARNIISEIIDQPVRQAVDIGCGPGYTTAMVSSATKAEITTGLDKSEKFIEAAKSRFPELKFKLHDITEYPFPVTADFMYCRFVISHMSNISYLINNWMSNLNDNGLLFIDELEDIFTENKLFKKYLDINTRLIKSQGANLFIGGEIVKAVPGLNMVYNESAILPVQNRMAAFWFYPNTVSVWKNNDFVKNIIQEDERSRIAQELFNLSESNDTTTNITWKMKRIIIKKK